MLFILAWLLWLHHQPINEEEKEKNPGEDKIKHVIGNSLNIENIKRGKNDDDRRPIIEDEIIESASDVQQQVNLDELDWDFATNEVKEAVLLRQQSVQTDTGNSACVVNTSNGFVVAEEPFVETRTANLASQPSLKRERAKLYSPNSSFTPIRQGKGVKLNNGHEISNLSIQVHNDDATNAPYEVSCYEASLKSPMQIKFDAGHFEIDDDELEDSEVAQAFERSEEEEEEEEDMRYTLPHGTKVTINHEPAGRIHSIVVKEKKQQPETKPSKIRIASPRMRATSPRVRAENVSPTIVSMKQEGVKNEGDMVHLVVNTHQMDVNLSSREHVMVQEENIPQPTSVNMVQSGNPDFLKKKAPQKGKGKTQPNIGKLPPHQVKRKDPNFLEKQTRQTTDFDAIMNRRKKFVDTMDDAGRLLGQIAHRDEKISGGRKTLSKHWLKIKEAVRRRQYLNFKEKPMR